MSPFAGKSFNPWFILGISALVAFIANGIRLSYGVFTIPLEQAFSFTRSQAILPYAFSMIVSGVAQPFAGILMDARGPRRAIVISVVLLALGFIVAASSQNLWQLTLGYGLLVGVAGSGLAVTAFSLLINRWFKEQRGKALGLAIAGIPLGIMVFSPLTAALISYFDWKGTFLILAAVMLLIVFPISWLFVREPDEIENVAAKMSPRGLFFDSEVWQAVKAKPYWMLIVKYFGCGFSAVLLSGHLPAIAIEHGFSAQEGATALGLLGAGGAVGVVLGGLASDRFGLYRSLVTSYLIRALGFFLLAFFVRDLASFYVFSIIAGVLSPLTVTTTHLIIYDVFGVGIAGRMMGLTFLVHQVGATIGPYFGGWIFEINGSYMWALAVVGVILLNSAFWSWRLPAAARKYVSTRVNSQA
jgi:MFS family permease